MRPPLNSLTQWRALLPRRNLCRAPQRPHRRNLLTLAIESSCDDTCVAVLSKHALTGAATLHFNRKVTSDCIAWGGVHPVAALRGHDASLGPLVSEAVASLPEPEHGSPAASSDDNTIIVLGVRRQKPTFITVTRGPGMSANLASGLATAKGLAAAWQVPLLGVNHMQAHALTPRLVSALAKNPNDTTNTRNHKSPEFPFLTLLVSGGHTQLVHSRSLTDHRILAATNNMAVGDALDKAARHILPPDMVSAHTDVMYGALLERFAFPDSSGRQDDYDYEYTPPLRRSDEIAPYVAAAPYSWSLTAPLALSRAMAYDFNGLGAQIRKIVEARGDEGMPLEERRVLARAAMRLLFEHLASRVFLAIAAEPELGAALKTLVVSGGVASNRFLMHVLRRVLDVRGFEHVEVVAPPPVLCTDNAAMIAWTGIEMYEAGWETELTVSPMRKWSIDPASEDGGILGLNGWVRRNR